MLSSPCKQCPGLEDTRSQTIGSNHRKETQEELKDNQAQAQEESAGLPVIKVGYIYFYTQATLIHRTDAEQSVFMHICGAIHDDSRLGPKQFFYEPAGGALLTPAGEELA